MSDNINLNKTVYSKNQYKKIFDTEFSSLSPTKPIQEQLEEQPSINDFFALYNELFFIIPKTGETNSHEFLIQQSSEYINFEPNFAEIEALQTEISQLRKDLLEEQRKNIELQTGEKINFNTVTQGQNTAGTNSGTPVFS